MDKKESIFKRIRIILSDNPFIIWAIGWVSFMPSVGSFVFLNHLYANLERFRMYEVMQWDFLAVFVLLASLVMGLALMPTTLVSIISGFLFGWVSFPFLAIAYVLATVLGYKLGRLLDQDSLEILLEKYPKTRQLIAEKQDAISQLIFFVRISPIIPFALSNLLFALIKAKLTKVVWVGFLGMLPRTILAFVTGIMAKSLLAAVREGSNIYQLALFFTLLFISLYGLYRVFLKFTKPTSKA